MKVLAERLRELKDDYQYDGNGGMPRRGISNEKLAQRLDVSTKSVKTWLNDEGDPSIPNLLALADFFGVDPDYLLGRTDQRRRGQGPTDQA